MKTHSSILFSLILFCIIFAALGIKRQEILDNHIEEKDEVPEKVLETFKKLKKIEKYEDFVAQLREASQSQEFTRRLRQYVEDSESKKKGHYDYPSVQANKLKPLQSEIDVNAIINLMLNEPTLLEEQRDEVYTYNSVFVIDGATKWSKEYILNPNKEITTINFEYEKEKGKEKPMTMLRRAQTLLLGRKSNIEADIINIYDKKEDEKIKSYLKETFEMPGTEEQKQKVSVFVTELKKNLAELSSTTKCKKFEEYEGKNDNEKTVNFLIVRILQFRKETQPKVQLPKIKFMPQINGMAQEFKKGTSNPHSTRQKQIRIKSNHIIRNQYRLLSTANIFCEKEEKRPTKTNSKQLIK